MKMVVLDGYTLNPGDLSWDELRKLGELVVYDRTAPDQVPLRARGAEVILVNKVQISAQLLNELKALKFISITATGYDIVDIVEAGRRGIPVSNVPEYGTDSVAQFTFALILELCHHVGLHNMAVKNGEWAHSLDWCFLKTPQMLLNGKKLGIVGFGRIGRRVGEIAHAFGMEVLAYDPQIQDKPTYVPFHWKSLKELFSEADVITLHCPQVKDNLAFVNRDLIELMKKEALLINAARGGLIDERALAEALNSKRISGAAVDVVSVEPPPQEDNVLLKARNCLITPHIAWSTLDARKNLMSITIKNIKAFVSGHYVNVVNEAYLKY
jgi:glycerate dehydrogenase